MKRSDWEPWALRPDEMLPADMLPEELSAIEHVQAPELIEAMNKVMRSNEMQTIRRLASSHWNSGVRKFAERFADEVDAYHCSLNLESSYNFGDIWDAYNERRWAKEEYSKALQAGDEGKAKQLMEEYPWLKPEPSDALAYGLMRDTQKSEVNSIPAEADDTPGEEIREAAE